MGMKITTFISMCVLFAYLTFTGCAGLIYPVSESENGGTSIDGTEPEPGPGPGPGPEPEPVTKALLTAVAIASETIQVDWEATEKTPERLYFLSADIAFVNSVDPIYDDLDLDVLDIGDLVELLNTEGLLKLQGNETATVAPGQFIDDDAVNGDVYCYQIWSDVALTNIDCAIAMSADALFGASADTHEVTTNLQWTDLSQGARYTVECVQVPEGETDYDSPEAMPLLDVEYTSPQPFPQGELISNLSNCLDVICRATQYNALDQGLPAGEEIVKPQSVGDFDLSWGGGDGIIDLNAEEAVVGEVTSVEITSDDGIVFSVNNSANDAFRRIYKYDSAGNQQDWIFHSGDFEKLNDLEVVGNQMVGAGRAKPLLVNEMRVCRWDIAEDGTMTLDASFNPGGPQAGCYYHGSDQSEGWAVTVDDLNRTYVAFFDEDSAFGKVHILRLTADGELDTTFADPFPGDNIYTFTDLVDGSGTYVMEIGGMGIVNDGVKDWIIISGTFNPSGGPGNPTMYLLSVDTNGDETTDILIRDEGVPATSTDGFDLAIVDDKILVAGYSPPPGPATDMYVFKRDADLGGGVVTGFDNPGAVDATDLAFAIAAGCRAEEVFLGGTSRDPNINFAMLKFIGIESPALDASFATDGWFIWDQPLTADLINDIEVDSQGNIYAGGGLNVSLGSPVVIRLQ
jgi:hypothetical protein